MTRGHIEDKIAFLNAMGIKFPQDESVTVSDFDRGIDACIARLDEMNVNAANWHNHYGNAAIEMAKLKELK